MKTLSYYQKQFVADNYDRSRYALSASKGRYSMKRELALLLAELPLDWTVLDVGAGTGRLSNLLQLATYDVYSIDGSKAMLNHCETAKALAYVAWPAFLPFKDNSFDVVLCIKVLNHLSVNPQRTLGELIRVARHKVVVVLPREATNWRLLGYVKATLKVHFSVVKTVGVHLIPVNYPGLHSPLPLFVHRFLDDQIARRFPCLASLQMLVGYNENN